MFYRTSYDTTVGKSFQMHKVVRAIQESAIKDGTSQRTYGLINSDQFTTIPWFIAGQMDSEAQIPFFNHPILIELLNQEEKVFCIDIRPYASFNKNSMDQNNPDEALKIRNRMELSLAKLRMGLNLLWVEKNPITLREISFIPMAVFANWIAESISKRFGLSPRDQAVIGVISCYYYFSLFVDRLDLDENEINRLIASTMKALKFPASIVEEVFDKLPSMANIKDFAKAIKDITENTRLQAFDEGVLVNVLIASWFGTNAREMIAIALEHPPTWIALVYTAFTEKSYKNTVISKIAYRYLGNKGENDFVRSLVSLINED